MSGLPAVGDDQKYAGKARFFHLPRPLQRPVSLEIQTAFQMRRPDLRPRFPDRSHGAPMLDWTARFKRGNPTSIEASSWHHIKTRRHPTPAIAIRPCTGRDLCAIPGHTISLAARPRSRPPRRDPRGVLHRFGSGLRACRRPCGPDAALRQRNRAIRASALATCMT